MWEIKFRTRTKRNLVCEYRLVIYSFSYFIFQPPSLKIKSCVLSYKHVIIIKNKIIKLKNIWIVRDHAWLLSCVFVSSCPRLWCLTPFLVARELPYLHYEESLLSKREFGRLEAVVGHTACNVVLHRRVFFYSTYRQIVCGWTDVTRHYFAP